MIHVWYLMEKPSAPRRVLKTKATDGAAIPRVNELIEMPKESGLPGVWRCYRVTHSVYPHPKPGDNRPSVTVFLDFVHADLEVANLHATRKAYDDLVLELQDLDEEKNGCCLHIAIVDYNLTDNDLDFCQEQADSHSHTYCRGLVDALRKVPEEHREALLGIRHEMVDNHNGVVHQLPKVLHWRGE